jgi:ubiquinone/menaquinone biosynthesis C-methylase UbiE
MSDHLRWTGERLVTGISHSFATEHLHRYAIALGHAADKLVLDIACGEGYGSNLLAQKAKRVIGVDLSSEAIAHASRKYRADNLQFKQGSAAEIPLPDQSVDLVVSFETIEHHARHEEMLSEIKRVLISDGLLIISSPDKEVYSDKPNYQNPFHIKELYNNEFRALIRSHFRNQLFLNQKQVFGSLVASEDPAAFVEHSGHFDAVVCSSTLIDPVFRVCVASDGQLPELNSSFFCAKTSADYPDPRELFALRAELAGIKASGTYNIASTARRCAAKILKHLGLAKKS